KRVVASKQLVSPVSAKSDGDVLAGKLADQQGRNLRAVGKGFVVAARKAGNHRQGVFRPHIQFGVVGAQVLGDGRCVGRFVVAVIVEADGEGANRARAVRLHQRDDGAAVYAAA